MRKYIVILFILLSFFLKGETLKQKIIKKYREYDNMISKHIKLIELKQEFLTGKYFPVTVKSTVYDYIDSIQVNSLIINDKDSIEFSYKLQKYKPAVNINPSIFNVKTVMLDRYYIYTGHTFEILLSDSFSVDEYDKEHYIIKNLASKSRIPEIIIYKNNYVPKKITFINIFSENKMYFEINKYKNFKNFLFIPEKVTFSTDSFNYGSLISKDIEVYEK